MDSSSSPREIIIHGVNRLSGIFLQAQRSAVERCGESNLAKHDDAVRRARSNRWLAGIAQHSFTCQLRDGGRQTGHVLALVALGWKRQLEPERCVSSSFLRGSCDGLRDAFHYDYQSPRPKLPQLSGKGTLPSPVTEPALPSRQLVDRFRAQVDQEAAESLEVREESSNILERTVTTLEGFASVCSKP